MQLRDRTMMTNLCHLCNTPGPLGKLLWAMDIQHRLWRSGSRDIAQLTRMTQREERRQSRSHRALDRRPAQFTALNSRAGPVQTFVDILETECNSIKSELLEAKAKEEEMRNVSVGTTYCRTIAEFPLGLQSSIVAWWWCCCCSGLALRCIAPRNTTCIVLLLNPP